MSGTYPEYEKLRKVADVSQEIGKFLDVGLSRIGGGLVLYEHGTRDCECRYCEQGYKARKSMHTDAEIATAQVDADGYITSPVQIAGCWPTHRTISSILADYFDIDQDKIDAEKARMLESLRGAA